MTLVEGPLVWPLAAGIGDMPPGLDTAHTALATATAVEWLWALSGRQFGTYSAVLRPQSRVTAGCGYNLNYLQSISGPLFGQPWPYNGGYDSSNDLSVKAVMELPNPVVSVESVTIYDVTTGALTTMLPTDVPLLYRVEGNYLVRQDGNFWPETQNLVAALGTKNTWSVQFTRGVAVPTFGQVAAAVLAAEFGKRFAGDPKCRIPFNTTNVTRAGVTINRDTLTAAKTTGVAEVDQWVAMVNPHALQSSPMVWSPDVSRNASVFAGSYQPGT